MELTNDFEVDRPIGEAWEVLTDVERIAPCLPGAQLQEIDGEEYHGIVKVKVGPVTAQYKGKASFVEKDDTNHKAVLKADGRDARQGNASAIITAQLTDLGANRTNVSVVTDLTVTGKVAQFGRGVMADVSEKLLNQFVVNLEEKVLAGGESSQSAPTDAGSGVQDTPATSSSGSAADNGAAGVRTINAPAAEPVDLLDVTGAPILKRLAPVLGVLFALFIARRFRSRRSSS